MTDQELRIGKIQSEQIHAHIGQFMKRTRDAGYYYYSAQSETSSIHDL